MNATVERRTAQDAQVAEVLEQSSTHCLRMNRSAIAVRTTALTAQAAKLLVKVKQDLQKNALVEPAQTAKLRSMLEDLDFLKIALAETAQNARLKLLLLLVELDLLNGTQLL